MPYWINQEEGSAPLKVAERRWGDAAEIDFGALTSCIVLVEQSPDEPSSVRAIHLSLWSPDTVVSDHKSHVARQIEIIMQKDGKLRACLGEIGFWKDSDSREVQEFFKELMRKLDIRKQVELLQDSLRVRMNNGVIQYQRYKQGQQGGAWTNL
ncbi:hypothetical protein [Burkholderia ubonensis]|uniref:hypothetical protein n=1 Tax=Burkholderia ubonensis TaxID=101571 RepID=UPI000BA77EC8|nr:hypothetical protein [Burkholderia ubonensis]PAJ84969.1 hypothetical protein CJO70_25515 [Burkholderia ubonensis]PAJ91882.1 hypothetical protein CJO69_25140 [Burkholderia ubonensis]PAK04714.1 hypothetical protein CJO67_28135 [Burkholderia ubonensis]PAK12261.1 hypothetical protein CJO66_23890 [Burkholderia ubonensis]RQP65856.1 hypothetical protein DF013_33540 [Burkholderia ubonensis]